MKSVLQHRVWSPTPNPPFPNTVPHSQQRWDTSTPGFFSPGFVFSADSKTVTISSNDYRTAIATTPSATALFTIMTYGSSQSSFYIGLASRDAYKPSTTIYSNSGAYLLDSVNGTLYGSGKSGTAYAQLVPAGGTVRFAPEPPPPQVL